MKKTILITAGEASGDTHAANLVKNLKKLNPDLNFFGIGGKKMQNAGVELVERMEKLSIIGIFEVFAKLKEIRLVYKKITDRIAKTPPDIAILVDYPGFNLTLAKLLKKRKVPVVYYITPQVWAWWKSRIYTIKKCVNKAIVILKFEEDLFKEYGIDATFVGHPLLDREIPEVPVDRKSLKLDADKFTIALLPGSRESEINNMLPVMLETARLILKEKDAQFILLKSSSVGEDTYSKILHNIKLPVAVVKDNVCGCLSVSDFVFITSGTATLESAAMERPMLITYKTSFITSLLFKIFAKTPFIGLVNIIAKRKIVPEILQYDARPERLAREILTIISSKEKLEKQVQNLRWVKSMLGTSGASLRAARIVNELTKK